MPETETETDIPDESHCPNCGAKPTEDSIRKRHLSELGYRSDEFRLECEECGNEWLIGIPVGEFDLEQYEADLQCPSCGEWGRPHWLIPEPGGPAPRIRMHLKCPECLTIFSCGRELDEDGKALVGYPDVTGETEGCEPVGYRSEDSESSTGEE